MPTVLRPNVTEIRAALGGLLQNDLKAAAGDDKILQPAEAARVLGFTARVANDEHDAHLHWAAGASLLARA